MLIPSRLRSVPQPNITGPLAAKELDFAIPRDLLGELDHARQKSFHEFARHSSFSKSPGEFHPARFAVNELWQSLMGKSTPRYYDEYITGAYFILYQLRHCIMAFRTYVALLRRFNTLRELYVCDVGAGAEAGLIGLRLALGHTGERPLVTFQSIEPSKNMHTAGMLMFNALTIDPIRRFRHSRNQKAIATPPADIEAGALRIVTAFHLSLPWNEPSFRVHNPDSGPTTLTRVLEAVDPDIYLGTCHSSKLDSFQHAVGRHRNFQRYTRQHFMIPTGREVPSNSISSRNIAEKYGFRALDRQPFDLLDKKRFKTPEDAMLYCGIKRRQHTSG